MKSSSHIQVQEFMLLLLNGQIIVQNISSNMHGKEMSSPNTLGQLIFQRVQFSCLGIFKF